MEVFLVRIFFIVYILIGLVSDTYSDTPKGSDIPPSDGYFAQHDLCEHEIAQAERRHGIPQRLLMAIGTIESGRELAKKKGKRPWPWTVCVKGKGYYFSTKSAAIATVKKFMGRGIRNIDVGCMQVNLMHHSKAFKTLEEAFTPKNNVTYAAKYFTELRQASNNSWHNAVRYYHSKIAKYYKPYYSLVLNEWQRMKNRKINMSPRVQQASSEVKSKISFLPSYYSLIDSRISAKLHKLGRQSITSKKAPKFFTSQRK